MRFEVEPTGVNGSGDVGGELELREADKNEADEPKYLSMVLKVE
jgi:hypothetical protein